MNGKNEGNRDLFADINLESPLSSADLIALMTWPKDPAKRCHFKVAASADIMTILNGDRGNMRLPENPLAIRIHEHLVPELRKVGFTPMQVGPRRADTLRQFVDKEHFQASGGLLNLVAAPSYMSLKKEWRDARESEAGRAGLCLCTLATIKQKHRDFPATLNRAYAAVEKVAGDRRMSERYLKDAWKSWGWMSPLWAAYIYEREASLERTITGWPLLPRNGRLRLIATAKWFRILATTHTSPGASRPLLSEKEAVDLPLNVTAQPPDLPALTPEALEAAQKYSVRAIRQD